MIARFVYAFRYFRRDLGLPLGRELRISWPWRGEPLVMLRWSGSGECWHWGRHHSDLWLGRLSMRLLGPRYALGSLLRLFTHGDQ